MSLRDIATRFGNGVLQIQTNRVRYALEASMDITALAKTRIINLRVNEFNEAFGIYADSTWRQKQAKKDGNRAINFSETNRMWESTIPQIEEITGDYVSIVIKPSDPGRAEVFGFHQERFGPLMVLNDRETAIFLQIYEAKLLKHLP